MFTPLFAIAASAAAAIATPAAQQGASATAPTEPAKILTSLAGSWDGALQYRDYRTQNLEEIPVRADMELLPDNETMVQRFTYTDPGFLVYSTNLVAVKDDLITGATARAGRAFETYEQKVEVNSISDDRNWTITLRRTGTDDGRPAAIRELMVREGGTLTITKEFDFLDDEGENWEFRNRLMLTQK